MAIGRNHAMSTIILLSVLVIALIVPGALRFVAVETLLSAGARNRERRDFVLYLLAVIGLGLAHMVAGAGNLVTSPAMQWGLDLTLSLAVVLLTWTRSMDMIRLIKARHPTLVAN